MSILTFEAAKSKTVLTIEAADRIYLHQALHHVTERASLRRALPANYLLGMIPPAYGNETEPYNLTGPDAKIALSALRTYAHDCPNVALPEELLPTAQHIESKLSHVPHMAVEAARMLVSKIAA